jgi:hypothetical protein
MKEEMKTGQVEVKVTVSVIQEKMEAAISSILSELEAALKQQREDILACVDQRTLKENWHSIYAKLKCSEDIVLWALGPVEWKIDRNRNRKKRRPPSFLPTNYTLHMVDTDNHNRLCAERQIGEEICLMTINPGAVVTVAWLDTVAGLLERAQSPKFTLQMASGETFPILKGALVISTLGCAR